MSFYPQAPQTVGRLLDAGFGMFRGIFRAALPMSAVAALVAQAPQFVQQPLTESLQAGTLPPWFLWAIPAYVAWLVLYMASFMALVLQVDTLGRGEPPMAIGEALAAAMPRLLPGLGTGFLYVLILMIGFVLLLVPGFLFMISLGYCWYFVLLEKRGPLQAIGDSHRLVWGNWWRTAAVLTVAFIVYSVPVAVIGGVVGVIAAVVAGNAGDGEAMQQAMASITLPLILVQFAASALLMPMLQSMMLVQFRDLQLRKSGSDLVARMEAA